MNQRNHLPTAPASLLRRVSLGGAMILLTCMPGGCAKEDPLNDGELVPLQVKASIGAQLTQPVTRDYDPIGTFAVIKEGNKKTYPYSAPKTPGEAWTSSSPAYVGVQKEKIYIVGGNLTETRNVGSSSSFMLKFPNGLLISREFTAENYQRFGVWYASTEASKSSKEADFGSLQQFCACFTFNITNHLDNAAILSGVYIKTKGGSSMTVQSGMNLVTQALFESETDKYQYSDDTLPYTLQPTNTFNWITAPIISGNELDLVLTINGRELSVRFFPNMGLESGKRYILNLVLDDNELTLNGTAITIEDYGSDYQKHDAGDPESYGVCLYDPARKSDNFCSEQRLQYLSKIRWAEDNLLSPLSGGYAYCGLADDNSNYHYWGTIGYDESTVGTIPNPCEKLDPSVYGTGWRLPLLKELEALSYCYLGTAIDYTPAGGTTYKGTWAVAPNGADKIFIPLFDYANPEFPDWYHIYYWAQNTAPENRYSYYHIDHEWGDEALDTNTQKEPNISIRCVKDIPNT